MQKEIELGKKQTLTVVNKTDFGIYLNVTPDEREGSILLPKAQVPEGTQLNDELNVFVYKDSEDRLIATTWEPALMLGEVARLKVKEVNSIGAFLEWELPKDLLLPFKEQLYPVNEEDAVLVTLYIDKSERLAASMHVYDKLKANSSYQTDDEVFGRVYEISENFGVFVAVDDIYSARIPKKEVFKSYRINEPVHARVTRVLDDGRLELSVRKKISEQLDEDAQQVFDLLNKAGGFLPYHDKSSPDAIKMQFHMSKNAYKRAIGHLLKEGHITITEQGIQAKQK